MDYEVGDEVVLIDGEETEQGRITTVNKDGTYTVEMTYRGYTIQGMNVPPEKLIPMKRLICHEREES